MYLRAVSGKHEKKQSHWQGHSFDSFNSLIFIHMKGVKTAPNHPRFVEDNSPAPGDHCPPVIAFLFSPIYFVEACGSPSHNRFHNADYIIGINQLHLRMSKSHIEAIEVLKRDPKSWLPAPTPSSKRQDTHKRRAAPWVEHQKMLHCTPVTPFPGPAQGGGNFCTKVSWAHTILIHEIHEHVL